MKQREAKSAHAWKGRRAAGRLSPDEIYDRPSRISLPPDRWLAAIIENSTDAIVGKTLDGVVISWNPGAEHLFGYTTAEMVGSHISIIAAPGRENEMPMILDRMRRGIPITHYDTVRRRRDGRLIDISLTVSPVRDASGTIIGASKIARDISERKSWEAKQMLLLRELSHRVKNSLAVIQAIARQTGRTSGSVGEFLDRFDDRLSALAAAHDLLVIGGWSGTSLAELGRSALRHDLSENGGQVHLALCDSRIAPSLALNLALALHELATNAAKFGALSEPSGRVTLTGREENKILQLVWVEEGGPAVRPPERRGFGTALLERLITHQHKGRVTLDWRPSGLVCSMSLLLDDPG